jgi:hypothetical protein
MRRLSEVAAALAAVGCLCLVATLSQRTVAGVGLKSRSRRDSDDGQLLDASGQVLLGVC